VTGSTRQALGAGLFYLAVTCAFTWPLISVVNTEIAADMGDPVFVCWVLLWTSGQVMAFLSGDMGALSRYWQGNIFYPEPLTLAYSEHFTAQMAQAFPILAATNNVVLAYNLLFISTFVMAGLGMFLLVRDLTGRPLAGLVAGLAFAFAPYRVDQFPHLQVLSSQWMPFVLYGIRRYLESGRPRALAGAAIALILQNLSCGYYVMFFAPFAGAYVIYEMAVRRRLTDWATWRAFGLAGGVVGLVTLPFLTPYLAVRGSGVGVRGLPEIVMFSADTHAFATASSFLWLWGERFMAFPRAEGQLFPGLTIVALALTGVLTGLFSGNNAAPKPLSAWRQVLVGAFATMLVVGTYWSASALITGSYTVPAQGGWVVWHQAGRVLLVTLLVAAGLALALRLRRGHRSAASPWVFYAVAACAAAACALGPVISVAGAPISPGPYAWLMQLVPGFDGLRVPSRYMTVVTLFLAVLAGLGAASLMARGRRAGTAVVIVAAGLILMESWPTTFQTNVRLAAEGLDITQRELRTGDNISPIYQAVRDSQRPIILLEFPFGSEAWDLHAVFYAGHHRQRLVNGYSGFFPQSQQRLVRVFNNRINDPQAAWRALLGSGATHVLVHEAAFMENRQQEVSDWLKAFGAREILSSGTDRLFTVR